MNKTVVTSVSIVMIASVIISYLYIGYLKISESDVKRRPMDRFTTCLDIIMTKSIEAGKPISANEAKDICVQIKKA